MKNDSARYFIRRASALFLVGQEVPLYDVPSPNSKKATVFVRDFLMVRVKGTKERSKSAVGVRVSSLLGE